MLARLVSLVSSPRVYEQMVHDFWKQVLLLSFFLNVYNVKEKADISTASISKTLQLSPKQSRLINSTKRLAN